MRGIMRPGKAEEGYGSPAEQSAAADAGERLMVEQLMTLCEDCAEKMR